MTSDPIGDIPDPQGRELLDSNGERVGQIREIFLDETTGRPAWAAVDAPGGGDELVLAPLAHSTLEGDAVRVAVTRERVETSPSTSGLTERFSPEHMDRVRAHYADAPADMAYQSDVASGTARTGELPESIVRSEEALFIDRERVPRERVRLVKRIVTETVTQTVEVRREELHYERIPLTTSAEDFTAADVDTGPTSATADAGIDTTEPATGVGGAGIGSAGAGYAASATGSEASTTGYGAGGTQSQSGGRGLSALKARASELVGKAGERLGGGEHGFGEQFSPETLDLTLYEEQLVVSKRVVPRERVRVHREIVTEQQRISDELRKERVEVERIGLETESRVEDAGYRTDDPLR